MYLSLYIYIYIYIYTMCVCIYIYIYTHTPLRRRDALCGPSALRPQDRGRDMAEHESELSQQILGF